MEIDNAVLPGKKRMGARTRQTARRSIPPAPEPQQEKKEQSVTEAEADFVEEGAAVTAAAFVDHDQAVGFLRGAETHPPTSATSQTGYTCISSSC